MSKSSDRRCDINLFDGWVVQEFARTEGFTALVILVSIGDLEVLPLRSTYVHVVGDDLDWLAFRDLVRGAGVKWDGVVLVPVADDRGGPVADSKARNALLELEKRIIENRLVINEGHFFDKWGRRMKVEEAQAQ